MKNVRIVNIRKFVRSLAILTGIIIAIIFFSSKVTLSHNEKEQINYETISVAQGDTLWDIATKQQKDNPYYINKDVRYIVSELKNLNKLNSGNLQIGQELKVPVI